MKNKFLLSGLLALFACWCSWGCSSSKSGDPQPAKSSAKSIKTFVIGGVSGVVAEGSNTVVVSMPVSADLTALSPVITLSDKAAVSPASGAVQNFSSPVTYTVTAEDGSTHTYVVTIQTAVAVAQTIDCNKIPATLLDLGSGVDYTAGCMINLSGSSTVLTIKPGVTIQFSNAAAGSRCQAGLH